MRRIAILVIALAAACGGDDHPNNGDGGNGSNTDSANCINTAGPAVPTPTEVTGTNVKMTKLYTLNPAERSLLVVSPKNDARLFVITQEGSIWLFDEHGTEQADPFLDVKNVITADTSERGLLGLAFHPNYACNGIFFIDYTTDTADKVVQYTVKQGDINHADASSAKEILSIPDPFENHNGGMMEFGSDGYLYVSTGDGGSAGDPKHAAQATDRTAADCMANGCEPLLGKLLRIDIDHPANGKPYGIPANNPFSGGGGEPEILFKGLRNPWRWSFDRMTGDIYIGDVGQDLYEEVDVIPKGNIDGQPSAPLNFGWSVREGMHPYAQNGTDCNGQGTCDVQPRVEPVIEYDHNGDGWHAIIGGQVYRGKTYPAIQGNYYFTDNTNPQLIQGSWNSATPGSIAVTQIAGTTFNGPTSIHEAAGGEVFLADLAGNIWQLQAGP
ncbi:MAG: PQQ-dependent sugar dehydrogenase [Kofleriaceae bacterium]